MVPRPRNGLSLCAGGAGLDMGLGLAEPDFHTRAYVEWDAYPRSVIIAAQRAGYLAPAPIWDDLTTFNARPLAGAIDTLLAGYPCQPFSAAGQRRGEADERHLWPDVARVARELGDKLNWIFLENVAGHVSLGAETVLRELRYMGFTPAAGLFSAEETGATHERLRWFCVAFRSNGLPDFRKPLANGRCNMHGSRAGYDQEIGHISGGEGEPEDSSNVPDRRREQLAYRESSDRGCEQPEGSTGCGRAGLAGSGSELEHAESFGRSAGRHGYHRRHVGKQFDAKSCHADHPAGARPQPEGIGTGSDLEGGECLSGEGGSRPYLAPPGPADRDAWAASIAARPDLAPALGLDDAIATAWHLSQTLEDEKQAAAEPMVRRMVDGLAARTRALKLLGNGVHPVAAGYAWRTLSAAHGLRGVDLGAAGRSQ